jgi:hypothetical protein
MYKLYKFETYFGRMGSLEGIFIEDKERVKSAIGRTVYFGEVLGKHSEVILKLKAEDFKEITDDPEFLANFEEFGCETGYNPFNFEPFTDEENANKSPNV